MSAFFAQVARGDARVDTEACQQALYASCRSGETAIVVRNAETAWLGFRTARIDRTGNNAVTQERCALLDGSIYQTAALAQTLGAATDRPAEELLLRAWARWGVSMATHIHGEYAVVLHDAQARSTLLLRDHIGTRPLYWHRGPHRLSVATFLPDLVALIGHRPEPNLPAIAAYIRNPTSIGQNTFFADVFAVLPGHAVEIGPSGIRTFRWWRPEDTSGIHLSTPTAYGAAMAEILDVAVRDRLPGEAIRVGTHFSGGINSTAVSATAVSMGVPVVAAYSWSPAAAQSAPDMGAEDERPRIAGLAEQLDLRLRWSRLDGRALCTFLARPIELEGLADVADELSVLDAAAQDGVTDLLSGWGGDEAFSAHSHGVPAAFLRAGRPDLAIQLARRRHGLRRPGQMLRFLWQHGIIPALPDALFARLSPYEDIDPAARYLSHDLARHEPLLDVPQGARISSSPIQDICAHIEQRHIGERMATWAAWAAPHGITYHYPLTDRRLLEFVLSVPFRILWGDGQPRYLARAALRGRIQGALSKSDPANERKRLTAMREAWRILAQDSVAGRFDGGCDWLDMPALKRDLLRGPSGHDGHDLRQFGKMMPALRIRFMAERFDAIDGQRMALTAE